MENLEVKSRRYAAGIRIATLAEEEQGHVPAEGEKGDKFWSSLDRDL
jgi:hypothetical protein